MIIKLFKTSGGIQVYTDGKSLLVDNKLDKMPLVEPTPMETDEILEEIQSLIEGGKKWKSYSS